MSVPTRSKQVMLFLIGLALIYFVTKNIPNANRLFGVQLIQAFTVVTFLPLLVIGILAAINTDAPTVLETPNHKPSFIATPVGHATTWVSAVGGLTLVLGPVGILLGVTAYALINPPRYEQPLIIPLGANTSTIPLDLPTQGKNPYVYPSDHLSKTHQDLLTIIRTKDPNAVISISALADLQSIAVSRATEMVRDLMNLHLVHGIVIDTSLHLHESRVTCQLCDDNATNPDRYYQCDQCHRYLCEPCKSQFTTPGCTMHPATPGNIVQLPIQCSTCLTLHYDIKPIQQNQNQCPNCDTKLHL